MLFAFLDDIFVLSRRDRMRPINNLLAEKLHLQAGIQVHAGKTRTWNKSGTRPPDVDDLGPDVWRGEGIKVLDASWFRRLRAVPTPMSDWKKRTGCGRW